MWSMMNTLQLIMFILKYNIIVPGNTYLFFRNVEDFLVMKAYFIDDMLDSLQSRIYSISEKTGIITHLGTYFVAGIGLVVAIVVAGLLILLARRITQIQKVVKMIKEKLFFNSVIRFLIQAYLKFCEIGCLSLLNLDFSSSEEIGSSVAGILIFAFVVIFPLSVFYLMRKHRLILEMDAVKPRYGSAYLNIETNKNYAYWLTGIFLVRRLLLAAAVIFLKEIPSIQFIILIISSFLIIIYVIKVKPLSSVYLNGIEVFNEFMFFICSCAIVAFTDYGPNLEAVGDVDPSEDESQMRT
jgi:hypothetical protein